ncbi:MAG: signal peptidase II [Alphaproteobacteria bacterium]|nr:signal peptidase II [Alphaproteobacteria bacterium]
MKKIIFILLSVILVDQLTKGILLYMLTGGVPLYGSAFDILPYPYLMGRVTGFFNLVFTWNPGTAFSLFREMPSIILIALTGVIIGALGYHLFKNANRPHEKWALSLIVGGAVGNLIDRIRFGAVVDFLDLHAFGYHWPAFNFADICISIGVAIYIIHWLFFSKKAK